MVLDEHNQKWACTSCVRGHRSAKCGHADRWLVAVKPSGRPRTSDKCDHPDKEKCDCNGIRKILMVAIPNDQKCACTGAHTCYRGKQLYVTRVKNEEDTPTIPAGVLAYRAGISEAFRIGGPAYVQQWYPDFYSGACAHDTPHEFPNPTISSATSVGAQQQVPQPQREQKPLDREGDTAIQKSCCQPKPSNRPGASMPSTLDQTLPQKGKGRDTASSTPTPSSGFEPPPIPPNEKPPDHDFMSPGMGTPSQPITWDAHNQFMSKFKEDIGRRESPFNCKCGDGCQCKACLLHPFNYPMRKEIQSLAPLVSPTNTVGFDQNLDHSVSDSVRQVYPGYSESPLLSSHRATASHSQPTFMNSGDYRFHEYTFDEPGFDVPVNAFGSDLSFDQSPTSQPVQGASQMDHYGANIPFPGTNGGFGPTPLTHDDPHFSAFRGDGNNLSNPFLEEPDWQNMPFSAPPHYEGLTGGERG